jgi:threonine dehydrogenase-like Zn-dependent dehydrogenase
VVIDAVGAEADGNFTQHVTSAKFKLQGGSPVALNWAIDTVRKGGTVSVVGAYGPLFSAVKFGDAMNKGLTLRMNPCPVKRLWPRQFQHVRTGCFAGKGCLVPPLQQPTGHSSAACLRTWQSPPDGSTSFRRDRRPQTAAQ